MQSQFYAGDSGSVSHKNVDQTATSRARVLRQFQGTRFVEYVDGAGYFSSLNADLRRLLQMDTTHSFIQIRSAPIRLRRELQSLGFVTPLDIEQAIARTNGNVTEVGELLTRDGFAVDIVTSAIDRAVRSEVISRNGSILALRDSRRQTIRLHMLMDTLAAFGHVVTLSQAASSAYVLVSGYGPLYGLEMDRLVHSAIANAGSLRDDVAQSQTFAADVRILMERGLAIMR